MNDNNDVLDSELEAIFANQKYKTEAFVVILDNARKNSVGVNTVEKKSDIKFFDSVSIKEFIKGICVSALVLVISINALNKIQSNLQNEMKSISIEIGALVQEDSKDKMSIVSQNTVRNGDTSFYRQDAIARDLLSIDEALFDYAFCAVCNDMGSNIDNKVGFNGMSNIDSVIYFLKLYSSIDGGFSNKNVNNSFQGVSSLNEYLLKHGYVDKAGNPSFAAFKEHCDKNSELITDLIQSHSKGAGKL